MLTKIEKERLGKLSFKYLHDELELASTNNNLEKIKHISLECNHIKKITWSENRYYGIYNSYESACKQKYEDVALFLAHNYNLQSAVTGSAYNSARYGLKNLVLYFIENKSNSHYSSQDIVNSALSGAIAGNHLELAEFLLNSETLKYKADIHHHINLPLIEACFFKNVEPVKFLLMSPRLKEHANIMSVEQGGVLVAAAKNNNLELIKYFLTNKELNANLTASYKNDDPIKAACENGSLDVVKYLLSSPELIIHANIYHNHSEAFGKIPLDKKGFEVIKYLIFEYDIKKTPGINDAIKGRKDIVKMFEKRDFKNNLQKNLNITNSHKPIKLKI